MNKGFSKQWKIRMALCGRCIQAPFAFPLKGVLMKCYNFECSNPFYFQVMNAAWDAGIPVASVNPVPCHDRDGYNRILENAKPRNDPDGRHLIAFTYLRLSPTLMERANFCEFDRFVKRMHGKESMTLSILKK
jgi:hypothetical protein